MGSSRHRPSLIDLEMQPSDSAVQMEKFRIREFVKKRLRESRSVC